MTVFHRRPLASALIALGIVGAGIGSAAAAGIGQQPNHMQCSFGYTCKPGHIDAVAGDGQKTQEGRPFHDPLVAEVVSSDGSPVEGATVEFKISGPATFGRHDDSVKVDTNHHGDAESPIIESSDHHDGVVFVTATVRDVDKDAHFRLEVVKSHH